MNGEIDNKVTSFKNVDDFIDYYSDNKANDLL